MKLPNRFIQVDEEGFFMTRNVRVEDHSFGSALLRHLKRNENGLVVTESEGTEVAVEAFDEPLVVRHVEHAKTGEWNLVLPYAYREVFDPTTFSVDEWDRFHGHTRGGIPFVLSRPAQAELFDLCDEFDDDSITVDGKRIAVEPWLKGQAESTEKEWWDGIHQNQPPFDLHQPAPALVALLDKLKLPKSRILILGAGQCNDATYLADQGHLVTAVDFSAKGFDEARSRGGARENLQMVEHDIFKLPRTYDRSFDLIFEHTCYCAVDPARRNDLVAIWRRCLVETGHLFGIFFAMDKPQGPPFGGSEWEVRQRLKNYFQFIYWSRSYNSIESRQGKEFFVYGAKK